jgi:hypothetical protein
MGKAELDLIREEERMGILNEQLFKIKEQYTNLLRKQEVTPSEA